MQRVQRWRPLAQLVSTSPSTTRQCVLSSKSLAHGWRNDVPWIQKRHFGLSSIPTVLLPPTVFVGLFISLWTYKCLMMVVFQDKIIYMPSVPPFSRSEKVSDYTAQCRPVEWVEIDINSGDGTALKLLEGSITTSSNADVAGNVVIVYFQG